MATVTHSGKDFVVFNFSVGTGGSTIVLNDKRITSFIIQCRTGVDLYIRRNNGDSAYFTVKTGTVYPLDMGINSNEGFHVTSGNGTVNVEIIGFIE